MSPHWLLAIAARVSVALAAIWLVSYGARAASASLRRALRGRR